MIGKGASSPPVPFQTSLQSCYEAPRPVAVVDPCSHEEVGVLLHVAKHPQDPPHVLGRLSCLHSLIELRYVLRERNLMLSHSEGDSTQIH
jgi:hypothetical protein